MKTIARWVVCAMLTGVMITMTRTPAGAQVEVNGQVTGEPPSSFFIDAVSFAGQQGTGSRLDVFVYVGYEILSFVKMGDLYDASYEITISVLDTTDGLVNEKLWTEEIRGVPFERSVSANAYSLTQRVFSLSPGIYKVRVNVRDRESKVSWQLTRRVLVLDFGRSDFLLSDLLLLSKVSMQGERRSIVPSVSPNLGLVADQFYAYFEVYNGRGIDSLRFQINVLDKKGESVITQDTLDALRPGRNERILRIPHASLPMGDYQLRIRAYRGTAPSGSPEPAAVSTRIFIIRWPGIPRSVQDLDVAIEQLRYIAKDDELSILRDASTPDEKQARFLEFWKKRDPNPNTPRNEKLEEFYARVEYANKHFSHYTAGWKTDMGMIYIIFGAPNSVDRHPFEVDSKPYEIWSYYDLNYSFVFVDQTGFGDYRLESPLWEVWNRPRY